MFIWDLSEQIRRLLYGDDDELLSHPRRKSMDGFLLQVVYNAIYGILVGGVFLSGYLIYLGMPDKLMSYLTSAQMICGTLTVFLVPWLDKKRRRRRLMISIRLISRFFQISIIFVPWLLPISVRPYAVALCLFLGAAVAAINDIVFNTWFAAVIPDLVKGRFYSVRQRVSVVVTLAVSMLTSMIMDTFQNAQYLVFVVIYGIAFFMTIFEISALRKIDDVDLQPNGQKIHLWDIVRVPASNREFMWYMLLCGLLYLFWFLSTTFNSIFQLKYLEMSYTYINIVEAIRYLLQLLIFYKVWGLICDKVGNSFALFLSILFNISDCVLWAMLSKDTVMFIYPVINILGAVGQTGFAAALFNRRYELIPEKGKVIYETFFSATIGITVLVSPFLGGVLRDFLEGTPVMQIEFGNIRAVYLVSALLITLLQGGYAFYLRTHFRDKAVLSKKNWSQCGVILKNVILRRE